MRKFLLLIVVLSFVLLSQNTKQKDHSKYFPLTVGSEWEYVWGAVDKDGDWRDITTITRVVGKTNDDIYVSSEETISNFAPYLTVRSYVIKNSLLLLTGTGGGIDGVPYSTKTVRPIILALPLEVGKEWKYTQYNSKYFLKVLKWHKEKKTKYGTFKDVFEIERIHEDTDYIFYFYDYYAYGIGLIMVEDEDSGTGKGTRSIYKLLKSYTIK